MKNIKKNAFMYEAVYRRQVLKDKDNNDLEVEWKETHLSVKLDLGGVDYALKEVGHFRISATGKNTD